MYEQINLFEDVLPNFKIKEPVILLEMFAGIGAQRKALSILNIKIDDETIERIANWKAQQKPLENAIDPTRERESKSNYHGKGCRGRTQWNDIDKRNHFP